MKLNIAHAAVCRPFHYEYRLTSPIETVETTCKTLRAFLRSIGHTPANMRYIECNGSTWMGYNTPDTEIFREHLEGQSK
jgi:hypothetical protein